MATKESIEAMARKEWGNIAWVYVAQIGPDFIPCTGSPTAWCLVVQDHSGRMIARITAPTMDELETQVRVRIDRVFLFEEH